jgi:hypothetical protein
MANICIIGTKGAGKTVFLSVLAKRYEKTVPGKPRLEFLNPDTSRYINDAWNKLTRDQDWPDSTLPGEITDLKWKLHTYDGSKQNHHITVLDSVGQDIREIFDPKPNHSFTDEQIILRDELQKADVLIVLINPVEAINAQQKGQISNVEIPVKMAIDQALTREHTQIAILLSQHDQVEAILENCDDPIESLAECGLHAIHGLAKEVDDRIQVFNIAAVRDTEPFVENGKTWLRPKKNFESEGLQDVMGWLVQAIYEMPLPEPPVTPPDPVINNPPEDPQGSGFTEFIMPIVAAILMLFFATRGCSDEKPPGFPDTKTIVTQCDPCGGSGATGLIFKSSCRPCNGTGKVTEIWRKCTSCKGKGTVGRNSCSPCKGSGYTK